MRLVADGGKSRCEGGGGGEDGRRANEGGEVGWGSMEYRKYESNCCK